jgi:hypothetical protein
LYSLFQDINQLVVEGRNGECFSGDKDESPEFLARMLCLVKSLGSSWCHDFPSRGTASNIHPHATRPSTQDSAFSFHGSIGDGLTENTTQWMI